MSDWAVISVRIVKKESPYPARLAPSNLVGAASSAEGPGLS